MFFDRSNYIGLSIPIENELKILFDLEEALTIFEVGACEGEDTIKYARLFPNSTIFSFEPLPANIDLMRENFAKYGITNVHYYNKALSSEIGTAELYVSEGRPEHAPDSDWDYGNKSSSLLPPNEHLDKTSFIKFNRRIVVQTITLKSFCETHSIKTIDVIHMDVQGAELMVLKGAENFIGRIKVIWLEVSRVPLYKDQPLVNEIESFMKENNFVLIKDAIEDIQGDRLYVSKKYYPNYQKLFKTFQSKPSLVERALKKLGL